MAKQRPEVAAIHRPSKIETQEPKRDTRDNSAHPAADLDDSDSNPKPPKSTLPPSKPLFHNNQKSLGLPPSSAFEEACIRVRDASQAQTKDPPPPVYQQQEIHEQNAFGSSDPANQDESQTCPPAGSVPYPLDRLTTSTHNLYINPPLIPLPYRKVHLDFQKLVGDPGSRNGIQSKRLDDWREVPEGTWSTPTTLGDGACTWEETESDPKNIPEPRLARRRGRPAKVRLNEPEKDEKKQPVKKEEPPSETEEEESEEIIYKPPRKRKGKRTSAPSKRYQDEEVKRVKNKRIERPFIIGSEAWPLDETNTRKADTPTEHTKGWRVYLKVPPGQPEVTTWLKKVQFKIFHTYANSTRMVDEPPFQIEETGWGGFNVEVKLFFVSDVGARPQDRSHFLQLEPYGTEAEQEKQKREKLVRSELLDYVEFNEPTETMFDLLTSEDQFKVGKTGKGKGKAKLKREEGEEATVALPETSSPANPYSKELEQQLMEILKKAESQVDEQLQAEVKKAQTLEAQRKEIQADSAK